ncbi:MAG: DNA polymerase III subunit beta, partial [Gammaproteobacteria bacterium]|nr:DNA polymerase III subunit beta [Gammaproteobacteria bacterium]
AGRLLVKTSSGRYILSTLDAADYPRLDVADYAHRVSVTVVVLKHLIQKTQFAMAQQDVRYYLNGLLLEFKKGMVRAVATDGHRLALAEQVLPDSDIDAQLILPRKAVLELQRLLADDDEMISLKFSSNQVAFELNGLKLTSKLIDGRFPDYERVIPPPGDRLLVAEREPVRAALARVAILANEKFHGVRLTLADGKLKLQAQNPEQEEAEEELLVDYSGDPLEIGFNVSYLLDAIGAVDGEKFEMQLRGPDTSGLIKSPEDVSSRYVVMPMRL